MLTFIPWHKSRRLKRIPHVTPLLALPLSEAKRVLVFAPHPDDETLGCGGTLAQLSQSSAVRVVLVTDGSGAGALPPGHDRVRLEEFRQALGVLGISDFISLGQPDGDFTVSASLLDRLAEIIDDFRPDWVFLPSPLDYHRDHIRISACLEPLCRNFIFIQYLIFYETWAPVPATHLVDITDFVAVKEQALNCHTTALAHGDYCRAIDGLNRYRGIYLGRDRSAEAFWVETRSHPVAIFGKIQNISLELLDWLSRAKR